MAQRYRSSSGGMRGVMVSRVTAVSTMNAAGAASAPSERASSDRHRTPATTNRATNSTARTTPPGRHPAASDVVPPRNIRPQ